jgi:hypothetical protein
MISRLLVFISSTSDLRDERQALKELIGRYGMYEPYLYEDEPARRESPEERCREMVQRSDIFVGLLGAKYGTSYPPPGDGGSIVEWEFETAREREDLGLMTVMIKRVPAEQVEQPQRGFIERVRAFRATWCKEYGSTAELGDEVLRSLVQWSAEIASESLEAQQSSKRRLRRHLIPVAVGSVLVLLALFALSYAQVLPLSPAVLVGACALDCVLLLSILLILSL